MWQDDAVNQFFHILEGAKNNPAVRENASELLRCLSWSKAPDGFVGRPDELKDILLKPGVAKALWNAATAQRIHYRFQQRLIEIRRAVLDNGIGEDQLPIPDWLAGRVAELGAKPSTEGPATTQGRDT